MTRSDAPHQFSEPATCILHPTDFSPGSNLALLRTLLRLALQNQANLILLHVFHDGETEHFPSVSDVLQRWGLIEADAPQSAVTDLGISIEKIEAYGPNVVDAISNFLHFRSVDMLVMATAGRDGLSTWFHPSMAEQAARKTDVATLFVPTDCQGCVSLEGEVSLDQILVPVDHDPASEEAVERGLRALSAFGDETAQLTLLHVGEESNFPHIEIGFGECEITRVTRQGDTVTLILDQAKMTGADLLIMTTDGRHGFYDVLRGTTTEQVLRQASCPLLAVPANAPD